MDYQTAEAQAMQLQQQANQVAQKLRELADKLQTKVTDPNLSRELMLDLREGTLAIQQQNQSALMLIQQMAQYIHALESNLAAAQPQPPHPTARLGLTTLGSAALSELSHLSHRDERLPG